MGVAAEKLAGRFLVIDGPDGAGKTTQCQRLAERLTAAGVAVRQVRDPGGTRIGDRIREILLDNDHTEMSMRTELMLYMASRAQLVAEVIRPALAGGACVISDRYISSTVAYQGAAGADPQEVLAVGEVATGGLWPDLTILLDLPAEFGLGRVKRALDRMEAKGVAFHTEVRRRFQSQQTFYPGPMAAVEAAADVNAVSEAVWDSLSRHFAPEAPRHA